MAIHCLPVPARRRITERCALSLLVLLETALTAFAAGSAASRPAQDGADTKVPSTQPGQKSATLGLSDEGMQDLELLNLEVPTVVTASRREQKITTVPYAMSVVTAEDIRRSGARTVGDALRQVAGMDISDLGFNQQGVAPRGFSGVIARTVLVLMDGRQMYDSTFGGTLWASWPIQLEDIDHIEVIRGPGGVTWGSNAVDGVINIITKDPKDQIGVTSVDSGGFPCMQKEHLGYGFVDDKLRMRVSGEYEGGEGFTKGGSILRELNDEYRNGRMGVYGVYDAGPKDTITFSGGSDVMDQGYSRPVDAGLLWTNRPASQAEFILGKWKHAVAPDNTFELTGYVNDFWLHHAAPSIDYRYQQLAIQLGHTFKPSDDHTITWGIDSRTDLVDTSNSDPFCLTRDFVSTAIIGAYVQDEWRFAPKWTLNLGGRIDYEFYGGFQPSARAALSYELKDNQFVYGAVSRAFQMPAVGFRFYNTPMMDGIGRIVSPQDLKPETLIAYEVGYRAKLFDRLQADANVYWNSYDDLTTLSPRLGPPALLAFEDDNRATASTYGIELEGRYAVSRQLTLLGNYTYQQLNWNCDEPFTDKDLMTPPKHKFMLGTRYDPFTDVHLSSELYYVDSVLAPNSIFPLVQRHIPQYFRLDLRAEYEFWKKQAAVAIGVRNLLDPHHYEGGTVFLNNAEVPRMVYLELRLHFDK